MIFTDQRRALLRRAVPYERVLGRCLTMEHPDKLTEFRINGERNGHCWHHLLHCVVL